MRKSLNEIEKKWSEYWQSNDTYKVSEQSDKPKYYVLDMFPYPSGAGLHVGHPLGYIASDIYARYKRMKGFNVLHPMGFDAFGLPAEQYALQTGIHPAKSTEKNMKRYKEQLGSIGFSIDWNREVVTSDPSYYKWTQWIFSLLFERYYDTETGKAQPIKELISHFEKNGSEGVMAWTERRESFTAAEWLAMSAKEQSDLLMDYRLAYLKEGFVNWCEELGTVLANDQIKDGVSERGGYPVVQKPMTQWYLRITAYAQRMLDDLDNVEWSEALKTMQRNWIGRSEGAQVFFDIENSDHKLEIYTTRADTIFGATFMVIAPEHPIVAEITTSEQTSDVEDYIKYAKSKSQVERMADKTVSGVFTGSYCIHPFTGDRVPIWISEYVLVDYGTGAIMAVPADDERDQRFAEKYGIDIVPVVDKTEYPGATLSDKVGKIINSDFINGMEVLDAIEEVINRLEQQGIGKRQINYKLRDANFSRQRYWGEPFPVKYDAEGIPSVMSKEELPLELPDTDDFKPAKGGQSPLARLSDWIDQGAYTRESDTMPAVAGSSWYYLRYMDPQNDKEFASQEAVNYWRDVDLYVGGAEHAVAHLMYARFWHKFLHDLGYVPTNEPFKKLINQGKIQGIIESIYLDKDKGDTFYSADMADLENGNFAKIPVHIDYVKDYGTDSSHLDDEGLRKFVEWIPEYKNAKFVHKHGTWTVDNAGDEVVFITHSESGKMSKSKFNVINPDDIIAEWGADCFRMYEMFLGPIEADKPWDTKGISGVDKFLKKFVALFNDEHTGESILKDEEPTPVEQKVIHTAIKKVTEDIERFSHNTCVSTLMVTVNELRKMKCSKRALLDPLVRLLAPFAPFLSEELWHQLGDDDSVHMSDFPVHEEKWLVEDEVEYPVCFNGKKKLTAKFASDMSPKDIEAQVLAMDSVQDKIKDLTVRKVIVVPKKMINLVVG